MSMDFYTKQHPSLNKAKPEFRDNDLKHATVKKSNPNVDIGLRMEKRGKQWFIKEVIEGGLFQRMHSDRIQVGDRLVKLNGEWVDAKFTSMFEMNKFIQKASEITVHVARQK